MIEESIAVRVDKDVGLQCLVAIFRLHGIATDVATLQQRSGLGFGHVSQDDLVRQARRHGLKARVVNGSNWDILPRMPLPSIGRRLDGTGFFIVVRLVGDKAVILDGSSQKPDEPPRDFRRLQLSSRLEP